MNNHEEFNLHEEKNDISDLIVENPSDREGNQVSGKSNSRQQSEAEAAKKRKLAFISIGAVAIIFVVAIIALLSGTDSKKKETAENKITQPLGTDDKSDANLDFSKLAEGKEEIPLESSAPAVVASTVTPEDAEEIARINQLNAARIKSNVIVAGSDFVANSPKSANLGEGSYPAELNSVYGQNPATPNTMPSADGTTPPPSFNPVSMGLAAPAPVAGETNGVPNAASQGGRFSAGSQLSPSAKAGYLGDRRYRILQGKLVDAILLSAVKSDIPSQIIAQTTTDTYGDQGRVPLLPKGTRLYGEYSSNVQYGQAEIAAVWRRAITPQGVEIMLDSPSTNGLAIVGIHGGKVNNHYFQSIFIASAISLLGAGASNVGVSGDDQNNSMAQYRAAVQESFANESKRTLERRANVPPTITVKAGSRIKVLIAKDLDFRDLTIN